jgi:hypothetical protein
MEYKNNPFYKLLEREVIKRMGATTAQRILEEKRKCLK